MAAVLKPLDKFMAFAPPLMGEEEINEVADTLRSGWLTTGPKTERFELALAEYLGSGRGVAVSSCTAALHLGLKVLGVEAGQGVITTPLTFASTGHVIMYQGARPYFADIDPQTGNLSPAAVARFLEGECRREADGRVYHIQSGDQITTLLPVHYGGHPVELEAFWSLAEQYGLNILEDAAHAIGAYYQGKPVGHRALKPETAGALKNVAAFSFYATKNLSTGEGGYITASDDETAEQARVLSMYGISDSRKIWGRYAPKGTWVYDVADLGFKYNMMDIQACLGIHQLRKLPEFIRCRAEHAATYNRAFEEVADLVIRPGVRPEVGPAWHLYPLRLRPEALTVGRDDFIQILRDHNIGSSVLFIPLHYHSYYRKTLTYKEGDFPEAETFFHNLVNLPVAPAHTSAEVAAAADLIVGLLKKYRK